MATVRHCCALKGNEWEDFINLGQLGSGHDGIDHVSLRKSLNSMCFKKWACGYLDHSEDPQVIFFPSPKGLFKRKRPTLCWEVVCVLEQGRGCVPFPSEPTEVVWSGESLGSLMSGLGFQSYICHLPVM
jgi:hypothetical protein